MKRRQVLFSATAFVAGVSGCAAREESPPTEANTETNSKTPSASPPDTETETDTKTPSANPTEEIPDPSELNNTPDYDHTLVLRNTGTDTETVQTQITHTDTGEVVYSESQTVDSGEEREIFDFSNIEERFGGVESFNIFAETEQGADSVGFVTSRCHAIPAVVVSESGPEVEYAIC